MQDNLAARLEGSVSQAPGRAPPAVHLQCRTHVEIQAGRESGGLASLSARFEPGTPGKEVWIQGLLRGTPTPGGVTVTVTLTGGPHVNVLGLSPLTCSAIPVEGVVGGSGTAAHRLANRAKKGAGERRAPGSHPQEHGHAWANGELHAVRRQGSQIDTTTTPSTARNTTAAQGKATKRGKESKSNTPPARALPRMQRHSRPRHKSW